MSGSNGKQCCASAAPASAGSNGSGNQAAATVPPAALTIRPANEGDLVPLTFFFDTALRNDYFMRRGQLADILHSPYHQLYVAEIDAVLVGVAITTRGTRLVNALVHPGYRGLGIGRALIAQSGATEARVKLDMHSGNPRGFYKSLGFRTTGRRNGKGNIEVMRLGKGRASGNGSKRRATVKKARCAR